MANNFLEATQKRVKYVFTLMRPKRNVNMKKIKKCL